METRRAPFLPVVLLPLVATVGWLLLASHRSAAPGVFGRYSPSYVLVLGLGALNTLLLWRNAWLPWPKRSAFPALHAGGLELLLLLGTTAALLVAERLFGTRAFAPSDAAALVLLAAACLQLIPRPGLDSRLGSRRLLFHPAAVLPMIVTVGALLRLDGIAFGLPNLYDPDENWFVAIAREMLIDQNPNPRWFGHPGTTVVYLLAVIYGTLHWLAGALGLAAHSGEIQAFFSRYPTEIYVVGRLTSVAFGVATIVLTYAVAARGSVSRAVGSIAAALLALSPLHVMYSRLIRTDIQATFLVLVAFWFIVDIAERGRMRSVLLAGLITGVATATKYPAALIGFTAVIAVWFVRTSVRRRLALLGAYVGTAAAGLFIASPYLFLDMQTAIDDLTVEAPTWVLGHTGEGFFADLTWYLGYPCALAVSAGGALLAAAGIVLCLRDRSPSRWLLLSFPAVFLLFIAALPLRVRHWIMPLVPFLCMLAGYALERGVSYIRRRAALELGVWSVFMVMAVTLPLAKADLILNRELRLPDTRTLAADWILTHIPPGRRLVVEAWTPQLPADRYHYLVADQNGQLVDPATDLANKSSGRVRPFEKTDYDHRFIPYGHLGRLVDPTAIARAGADYLIITDRLYSNYVAEGPDCAPCLAAIQTYDALIAASQPVFELGPAEGRRRGPLISIYELHHRD